MLTDVLPWLGQGTVPSLMLALAQEEQLCEEKDPAERRKAWLQAMKQRMAQIALPYAILRSSMLQEVRDSETSGRRLVADGWQWR